MGGSGAGGGVGPAWKVDPIEPYLMFEYLTLESGESFISSSGLPLVVAHGPRETPGALAGRSAGKSLSSQSIFTALSSQRDITSTIPRSRVSPMAAVEWRMYRARVKV